MQTKVITYNDEEVSAELTVARANYRMGLIRSALIDSAREKLFPQPKPAIPEGGQPEEEEPRYGEDFWLRLYSYPALCAGTVVGKLVFGQPDEEKGTTPNQVDLDPHKYLTWEQYEDLPERLITQWENAIFELNPHWLPARPAEEQKKAVGESIEN